MMLNKKGKILSLYSFAVLFGVTLAISAMVYLFYGAPYNVRTAESELLINRFADCISYAGRINANVFSDGEITEEFLNKCHINFSSIEWDEEQFYSEISFYQLNNLDNSIDKIILGNLKWASNCAIQNVRESEKLAECVERKFYSLDDFGNKYIIKILVAIRKSEKNVKI